MRGNDVTLYNLGKTMDWQLGPNGRSYTATTNTYQAMIWKTTSGEWSALVSQRHSPIAHHEFSILKDAQAWCEAQIEDRAADSQNSKNRAR